jgi:hypothetical protein
VNPKRIVILLVLGMLLAACGGGGGGSNEPTPLARVTPWPAPSNPLDLAQKAGLVLENKEFLLYHVHSHLDVFIDGKKVLIPAGIGINIKDPGVRSGKNPVSYGGIKECAQPCISPLHTHTESGLLHTESKKSEPNTLGQFFIEWNVKLDANCVGEYCSPAKQVAVYVNGVKFTGDPATIELTNLKEIAIVIGATPAGGVPSKIPADATV